MRDEKITVEQTASDYSSAVEDLRKRLSAVGIDVSKWGTGGAKTVEHLYEEIREGEISLENSAEHGLLRKTIVGNADVYFTDQVGKRFHLKEDRQVFTDGRERKRDLKMAVAEKMKAVEDPNSAMIRGIQEELGLTGNIQLERAGVEEKLLESPSHPGLMTKYVVHTYKVELGADQFKPEGYVENQKDKSTYFVWEEIG